jgi:RHS repeat-associated protein
MAGRTVTEGYRYGFNAMEREDDLYAPGSAYDFGARMYDGRLGRWWSVDLAASKFPGQSVYAFSNSCPIIFLDSRGLIIVYANDPQSQAIKNAIQVASDKSVAFSILVNYLESSPAIYTVSVDQKRVEERAKLAGVDPALAEGFIERKSLEAVLSEGDTEAAFVEELFHLFQLTLVNGLYETLPNLESEAKLFIEAVRIQLEDREFNGGAGEMLGAWAVSAELETFQPILSGDEFETFKEGFETYHQKARTHYEGKITIDEPRAYNIIARDVQEN